MRFGPNREEVWRKLVEHVGGARYDDRGWLEGDRVVIEHGRWTLTLDVASETYTAGDVPIVSTYTRMRAPFVNADGFRFRVTREGWFVPIARWFGLQDIEIGDPFFDDAFLVQGNHEAKVRHLLADPDLKDLLHRLPRVHYEVRDDEGWFGARFPDGVDELYFTADGVMTDLDKLEALYLLFAHTLDRLSEMGSAAPRDPGVEL